MMLIAIKHRLAFAFLYPEELIELMDLCLRGIMPKPASLRASVTRRTESSKQSTSTPRQ